MCVFCQVLYDLFYGGNMLKDNFNINNIPTVLWGDKSEKVFIAVHGNMSNKEDAVIQILAEEANQKVIKY